MPDARQCSDCGAPIPRDAPFGNCPDCLVGLGLGPPVQATLNSTPARFGDYELLEPIGRGGMGVVYKARHLSLNRIIALKMLSPHSAAFPRVAERLRLEAEAAASLHHPNIVTIHDVGEHDGRPFFTMALVEGVGMDKLIGKSGFRLPNPFHADGDRAREPYASAVRTLIAIARAVDYAHKHGVLHRDLKPANVVLDDAGTPHLTDFGIAKVLGRERTRQTDTGFVLGTPAYMPPEQAAGGSKRVSTSGDIYSLGAVLYEMITGCPPFRGETCLDTLRRVSEEEPKSPTVLNPRVDSDLATICLKCLEKDPESRYPTAMALAEDLERWLHHKPIEARPVGIVGRFWRWCRREPLLAGMTVGLSVLISATTLLAWTLYYRERQLLASANEEKERRKGVLFDRIDKDWGLGGRNGIRVYAEELALLAERPYSVEGDEIEVVLGVHQPGETPDPLQILQRFALLVNSLPTHAPDQPDVRLKFELQLYPAYSNALAGLSNKEAHVMLLTPTSYVQHRLHDPEMQPLAQFSNSLQRTVPIVVFAHRESGFRTLSELQGKSLAFGVHSLPLFEDAIKSELWKAGFGRRDFCCIDHVTNGVFTAIRAKQFDAGVAALNDFIRYTNAGAPLQIIRELAAPNYLWVATGKPLTKKATGEPLTNRTAVLEVIRSGLLSIRDPDALTAVDDNLSGFQPVSATDFDDWESVLEKARLFDTAK